MPETSDLMKAKLNFLKKKENALLLGTMGVDYTLRESDREKWPLQTSVYTDNWKTSNSEFAIFFKITF